MEDIVYEIIGGAIILGIIILVISVFRNSAGTIRDQVEYQVQLEDVTALDTIGINGGVYNGTKIQEAYNYSRVATEGLQVWVKDGAVADRIDDKVDAADRCKNYASDISKRFKLTVIYLSEDTSQAVIPPTSNLLRQRGDKDISIVRFLFEKQ